MPVIQPAHEQGRVSIREILPWNRGEVLFQRYEVEEARIGGMAAVYICRTRPDGRVVIKIPLVELSRLWLPEQYAIAAVTAELSAWLRLAPHSHVVTLLDIVQFPFFELVDDVRLPRKRFTITGLLLYYGGPHNLREYLKGKAHLPPRDKLRLLAEIALGMQHAALHGVTPHLDLKPENVLVDDNETARITDFGISRVEGWQHAARVAGTPAYMAPEQWFGIRNCDQRTDIYAFGVLAYEMIAGRHPFEHALRDHVLVLRDKHCSVEPAYEDFPCDPETKQVVATCLAKEPSARFQTWNELLERLPQDLLAELRERATREQSRHQSPTRAIRLGVEYPELTGHAQYAGYSGRTATDIETIDALARSGPGRALYIALRGLAAGRPPSLWTLGALTPKLVLRTLSICLAPFYDHWKLTAVGAFIGLIVLWDLTYLYSPSLIEVFKTVAASAILILPLSLWAFLVLGRRRRPCPNCGGHPRRYHPLFRLDVLKCWGRAGPVPLATTWQCQKCGFMRASEGQGRISRRWWIRYDEVRFLGLDVTLARPLWRRSRSREIRFGCGQASSKGPA